MKRWLNLGAVTAVFIAFSLIVVKNAPGNVGQTLVNVSYDPTRELYASLNPLFVALYEKETGQRLTIVQSHGGSSRQARRVISGEQGADVVTLGMFSDVDSLRKRGIIAANWADRLPNHSMPYTSTIVFVVRKGNPLNIKDWPDLLAPGLEVVTPDPRTSGNGKLAALAAWAATTSRGGSDGAASAYLTSLYQHVKVLDEGARDAATTFAVQEIGDVHLTWENEALREVEASKGRLQIVYPPVSILAEPYVTWVDREVARDGNLAAAKAYLTFLFSDSAQETIARLGYRPIKSSGAFPPMTLVPVTSIAKSWDDANEKFFAENGIIDTIMSGRRR
nr:sulfate ABC transporter substrate-binding protein [uncultured Rhodopila sp.]